MESLAKASELVDKRNHLVVRKRNCRSFAVIFNSTRYRDELSNALECPVSKVIVTLVLKLKFVS